ncbi:hypothetical protein EsH8_XII_000093 [Colletotrichum jinshuiense]
MDIFGDLSFGKAFHKLEAPDNRFTLDLVAAATKRHLICGLLEARALGRVKSAATEEVRSRFSDVKEIYQDATRNSCYYLRACIDEVIRLSPSGRGLLPRNFLVCGMTINGAHIPASTIVNTPH